MSSLNYPMYRGKVMKKKLIIGSLLAVFMLVAISFVSSAEVNANIEQRESPLYGIRTRRATTEKISNIIENIKTKFLGERMFFLPFRWISQIDGAPLLHETAKYETAECPSCGLWCPTLTCLLIIISVKVCDTLDVNC